MSVNDMGSEFHRLSVDKGWWDGGRNVGELLMLVNCELSEAMEEYRDGSQMDEVYFVNGKPEGFPVEIADALIRLLDICDAFSIDIDRAVDLKHEYNKTRPYRHGGKLA